MNAGLDLKFLGSFQVHFDGEPVTGFESDKARAMLTYLVVENDRPHRREILAELFWPEREPKSAKHNLSQVLSNIRLTIHDREAKQPLLWLDRSVVQFSDDTPATVDVHQFNALLDANRTHKHADALSCASCMARRREAVEKYGGLFLDGLTIDASTTFDEWLTLKREQLLQSSVASLSELSTYHEDRWELDQAEQFVRRLVALEPWREDAQLQLIRILAHSGKRGSALKQFEQLRDVLDEELGVEPEEASRRLYEHIASTNRTGLVHHVPSEATSFVAREKELADIVLALAQPSCRLLTILGPGGVGKSRLSGALAERVKNRFLDGVYFVPLSGAETVEDVYSGLAQSLGIRLQGSKPPEGQLLAALSDQELLLILDNFEQLDFSAGLIHKMLEGAAEVKIVLTSRVHMHFPMATVYPLGGLPLATSEDWPPKQPGAELLFAQRARQADGGFELSRQNWSCVRHICTLVEGLPLAIELAAAWVRTLSCEEIAAEIETGLQILSSPTKIAATHRSIQAVFDRSWQLLSDEEQRTFALLSMFRGSFSRPAAQTICETSLPVFARLVDQSLLQRSGEARFQLHELLRQYAGQQLGNFDSQTIDAAQRRMIATYLDLALDNRDRGDILAEESGNIMVAMRFAYGHEMWPELMRFANNLARHWQLTARYTESRQGFRWASAAAETLKDQRQLSHFLRRWARASIEQNDFQEASKLLLRSEEIDLQEDDRHGLANTRYFQARIAIEEADFDRAQELLHESRSLFQESDDQIGEAKTLCLEGDVPYYRGQFDEAARMARQALRLQQANDDSLGSIRSLGLLADIALSTGDYLAARQHCLRALELCDRLSEQDERANILYSLAEVERLDGDLILARQYASESLQGMRSRGDRIMIARALRRLSEIDADLGSLPDALAESLDAARIIKSLGNRWGLPFVLIHLGDVHWKMGHKDLARQSWRDGLQACLDDQHPKYGELQERLARK